MEETGKDGELGEGREVSKAEAASKRTDRWW